MKNTDFTEVLQMSPEELLKLQKTKGWPSSFVGTVIYKILSRKHKAKNYKGICEYFEVEGNGWGLEMGWFFICTKDSSDALKKHELGHLIQTAGVGGLQMLCLSIASMIRFWWRKIFKITKTGYYDWWFERQASDLGNRYVNMFENKHK